MEEDLPHPDPESQYSGTNAHLEMLKDMLMTYNMYDQKKVGMSPKVIPPLELLLPLLWARMFISCSRFRRFML
jgi:hypothetical protein